MDKNYVDHVDPEVKSKSVDLFHAVSYILQNGIVDSADQYNSLVEMRKVAAWIAEYWKPDLKPSQTISWHVEPYIYSITLEKFHYRLYIQSNVIDYFADITVETSSRYDYAAGTSAMPLCKNFNALLDTALGKVSITERSMSAMDVAALSYALRAPMTLVYFDYTRRKNKSHDGIADVGYYVQKHDLYAYKLVGKRVTYTNEDGLLHNIDGPAEVTAFGDYTSGWHDIEECYFICEHHYPFKENWDKDVLLLKTLLGQTSETDT